MAKKTVRTKYIKSLVEDKENLEKMLEQSTKESISGLLDESVNRTLRQMLSESDDDSFEVEEVKPDESEFNSTDDASVGDTDTQEDGGGQKVCGPDGCEPEDDEAEEGSVWDSVEDCKDEDGEYDLRGKDINTVIELIKSMDPDEDVRIVKNDDGTATVEPSDDEEFVIDMEDGDNPEPDAFEDDDILDGDDGIGADDDDDDYVDDVEIDDIDFGNEDGEDGEDGETVFELEVGDDTDSDDELNEELGYTTRYQEKSAMTMPSDNGDGNGSFNRGSVFDAGAPKGGKNNKRRWVGHDGENGGNAYSQRVDEEYDECGIGECGDGPIFEVEMDDMDDEVFEGTSVAGGARVKGTKGDTNHSEEDAQRHYRKSGMNGGPESRTNTNESRIASISRKANSILAENDELRKIAAQIKDKLNEAVVINSSLAKVIRLVTENSTTRDEKINILNRFNRVQTLKESRELYNQISSELKNAHAVNSGNLLNNTLTEAKASRKGLIVETNLLTKSDDLSKILSLQNRLDKMK